MFYKSKVAVLLLVVTLACGLFVGGCVDGGGSSSKTTSNDLSSSSNDNRNGSKGKNGWDKETMDRVVDALQKELDKSKNERW